MNNKQRLRIDEERLRQYNEMKPAAKKMLTITARIALKMMKLIARTAWHLPGIVKRLARPGHAEARHKKSVSSEKDRTGIPGMKF